MKDLIQLLDELKNPRDLIDTIEEIKNYIQFEERRKNGQKR